MVAFRLGVSGLQDGVLFILGEGKKGAALKADDVRQLGDDPVENILHFDPFPGAELEENFLNDGFLFLVDPVQGKDSLAGHHKAEPARHEFRHFYFKGQKRPVLFPVIELDDAHGLRFVRGQAGKGNGNGHHGIGALFLNPFLVFVHLLLENVGNHVVAPCSHHFTGKGPFKGNVGFPRFLLRGVRAVGEHLSRGRVVDPDRCRNGAEKIHHVAGDEGEDLLIRGVRVDLGDFVHLLRDFTEKVGEKGVLDPFGEVLPERRVRAAFRPWLLLNGFNEAIGDLPHRLSAQGIPALRG